MIHVGVELPAVDVISKNAPIHSVELIDVNSKSDGLIVHVFPPNESSTVTDVEQAVYVGWSLKTYTERRGGNRTYDTGSIQTTSPLREGVWYLSIDGLDGGRGPADVGRTRVNDSNHPTPYRYGTPLDRQRWRSAVRTSSFVHMNRETYSRE